MLYLCKKNNKMNSGIYKIINTINNKVYIGKSINIKRRFSQHLSALKIKSKDENRHLINAYHKYGKENFKIEIIEAINFNSNELVFKERELYWIDYFDSTNRGKGYNLRRDSSTSMFTHEETRKIQSENSKGENNPNYGKKWTQEMRDNMAELVAEGYKNGTRNHSEERRKETSEFFKEFWKDESRKQQMITNLKLTKKKKYKFLQLKNGVLVKEWDCVEDIIKENPTYKWQNIYSVCNGYKKRIYGFEWKKELKTNNN